MAHVIRRGTAADAEFLAWVTLAASRSHLKRGIWDVLIGGDEAGCLNFLARLAVAEPRSLYHYGSFLILEDDGERAAALCGFETRDAWGIAGDAIVSVQRELGWSDADAAASYQRVAPIWATCMPPEIGADFIIENVATLPGRRRRGLANVLLESILDEASKRGCKLAQITTYIGNHPAQKAYENAGFRMLDQKRCTELEKIMGVPGFIRLTRELEID